MRSHLGRGAFAWSLLAPTLALAELAGRATTPGPLALRWDDPNGLAPITRQDFEDHLAGRLGHVPFDHSTTKLALAVNWSGSTKQCVVELRVVRGSQVEGSRLIESPSGDCGALVPALLTVAALLVEAPSAEAEPEPPPPVKASEPRAAVGAPEPPVAVPLDRSRPKEPRLLVSLGAGFDAGLAPRPELGPAAAVAFTPSRQLRLGAQATLFFPHHYGARPGLSLRHLSGGLLACAMPLTGSLGLGLCGGASLHSWSSTGTSLPRTATRSTTGWTTGLAVRAEWRLARKLWWVGSAGANLVTRPLYFYYTPAAGGEVTLFRQQRVAPALFLGLTLELP